jgi:hypothetical protein
MLVIARCVSSSGLGCGHWRELVYAWHHAWPEIVSGLTIAFALTAAGMRYGRLLTLGVGLGVAVIVGFGVYYASL